MDRRGVLVAAGQPLELSWLVPAALSMARVGAAFQVVHACGTTQAGWDRGEELVGAGLDLFRVHGVVARPRLVAADDPARVILEVAEEDSASLIVVGSGSRHVLGLGSTVRSVLSHTRRPVLYVPRGPLPPSTRISRVLVAVGSEEDVLGLIEGVRLSGVRQVVVTHVPRALAVHVAGGPAFAEIPETSTAVSDATVAAMRRAGWSASAVEPRGADDAGAAVEAAAARARVDMVVVASRRRSPLAAALGGSGAYAIAERARRPVLFSPTV